MQHSTMDRISCTCIWVFAFVEGGKWRQYLISHDKSDWYTWFGIHACVSSRGFTEHLNWVHRIPLCQWILLQPKLYCWKGWNYLGLHTVRFLEDILLINSILFSSLLNTKYMKNCTCVYIQHLFINICSWLNC